MRITLGLRSVRSCQLKVFLSCRYVVSFADGRIAEPRRLTEAGYSHIVSMDEVGQQGNCVVHRERGCGSGVGAATRLPLHERSCRFHPQGIQFFSREKNDSGTSWSSFNPFTPESDQCQISPAVSPEILHHTVWRTWIVIAYSDEMIILLILTTSLIHVSYK